MPVASPQSRIAVVSLSFLHPPAFIFIFKVVFLVGRATSRVRALHFRLHSPNPALVSIGGFYFFVAHQQQQHQHSLLLASVFVVEARRRMRNALLVPPSILLRTHPDRFVHLCIFTRQKSNCVVLD
jgi:hypothetical protein